MQSVNLEKNWYNFSPNQPYYLKLGELPENRHWHRRCQQCIGIDFTLSIDPWKKIVGIGIGVSAIIPINPEEKKKQNQCSAAAAAAIDAKK